MIGIQSMKRYWFLIFIISSFSCGNDAGTKTSAVAKDSSPVNTHQNIDSTNTNDNAQSDSLLFISAFHRFTKALGAKNMDSLNNMVHFPLYGTQPFMGTYEKEQEGINNDDFKKYFDRIFDKKAKAIISDKDFNQFGMYDKAGFSEAFEDPLMVQKIWNDLDKNSRIGEAYVEYALQDGKEMNQSYLFGKVENKYQLIAVSYRNNL